MQPIQVYSIKRAADELVTYFAVHDEPEEYHQATTVASCEAKIRRMWYEPPEFSVYDPDMYDMKTKWMSEQVYR
eukprot:4843898-Pyramimonas_sp.AAC.2